MLAQVHHSRWLNGVLFPLCIMVATAACEKGVAPISRDRAAQAQLASAPAASPPSGSAAGQNQQVATVARRVIRTAELSVETDRPEDAARKVTAIAESKGGFVLSSDTSRWRADDGEETIAVSVVFRVPANAFDSTLDLVRELGKRVSRETVNGQDVTEEYVDLEARIKAQRAVEDQYLTILKEAKAIHDILEVQQKLGEVRTEIERAEGRRRFLENQTSLSTVTVHFARHIEAIEASGPGFGASIKKAGHDALDVSVTIVNGSIRALGFLVPFGLFIGAPFWLLIRFLSRRRRRRAAA